MAAVERLEQRLCLDGSNTVDVNLLSQWGGAVDTVATSGTRAYLGQGGSLVILDMSQPAQPQEVARLQLPSLIQGISVVGSMAYVTDANDGLRVVDVSNAAAPALVGGYAMDGWIEGITVVGGIAYVANNQNGLQIIDVSNPAHPVRLGGYDTAGSAMDVAVVGGIAYVADLYSVDAFDVSNPANPVRLGGYAVDWAADLVMSGTVVYAGSSRGLKILDMSNPASPVLLGQYDTYTDANGVGIGGNNVYVTAQGGGVHVLDVSNPAAPVRLNTIAVNWAAYGVSVAGGLAYITGNAGAMQVVDVSNPAAPVAVSVFDAAGYPEGVAVAGGIAYLAGGGTLQAVNVADPAKAVYLGKLTLDGGAVEVQVVGNLLYAVGEEGGLQIIDVSDPAHMVLLGQSHRGAYTNGVHVVGNIAYVADAERGLVIDSVSDPAHPVQLGMYSMDAEAQSVSVAGSIACVTTGYGGLQLIDVSDPARPVRLGGYDTPGYARGVSLVGNIAYVADGNALRVIDVSNPANPVPMGSYSMAGNVMGVSVVGSRAYVANDSNGLQIIDVSNPASPVLLGGYNTAGGAMRLSVAGNIVYVADWSNGLVVLGVGPQSTPTPPTDLALSAEQVAEDQPAGTLVGRFSATDVNASDTFTYVLVSGAGDTDNASFTISGGQLLTAGRFDFETKRSYSIRVQVTDSGGLSDQKAFTIAVTDLQEFGLQNGRSQRLTIGDSDGDQITFSLSGGGAGVIRPDSTVALSGTTAKSVLTISVKKGTGGSGFYSIYGIAADGLLKSISAAKVFVNGGIAVNTGGAVGAGAVAINLAGLANGSIDTHGEPISSLKMMNWWERYEGADQVIAPWIGSITVSGRKDDPATTANEFLAGDWEADLVTSSNNRGVAIGSIKVAGDIRGANVWASGTIRSISAKGKLDGSRIAAIGGIGSVAVAEMQDSDVLVGVGQGFTGRFATEVRDFVNPAAKLGRLTISGRKLPLGQMHPAYVANSHVSAGVYGTVSLVNAPLATDAMLHVVSDTGVLKVKSLSEGMVIGGTWKGGVAPRPGQVARPGLVEVVG